MTAWQRLPGSGRRVKLSGSIHRANEQLDFLQDVLSNFNGSFWPILGVYEGLLLTEAGR